MLYGTIETRRGSRRSPAAAARAAGRDRRLPDAHSAGVPPRQQRADAAAGADRRRRPAHLRGGAAAAAQHPAHQGVLDHAGREDRADRALVRRRRSRRHRAGGKDLSHGGRRDAAGDDARPRSCASSATPAARRSSATRSTTCSPRATRSCPQKPYPARRAARRWKCRRDAKAARPPARGVVPERAPDHLRARARACQDRDDDRFDLSFDLPVALRGGAARRARSTWR